VEPVAIPSSTTMTVRPSSGARGRSPRNSLARRATSSRSRRSTASSASGETRAIRTTSSLTTRALPSPTAPIASSGWLGTPSFRTTTTSSGVCSSCATSKATGTPPRGRPTVTTSLLANELSADASARPAPRRSL